MEFGRGDGVFGNEWLWGLGAGGGVGGECGCGGAVGVGVDGQFFPSSGEGVVDHEAADEWGADSGDESDDFHGHG